MIGLGADRTDMIKRASLVSPGNLLDLGQSWPPGKWPLMPTSIVVIHLFGPQWDCRSCACLIRRHPSSSDFGKWIHWCSFLKVSNLYIYFWAIGAQISDSRHLWVGRDFRGFSHDGCLAAVTVCLSEVSLQFLHSSRKFVACSWPKFKSVALQVIEPAMEVSIGLGHQVWFVSRFLSYILLRIVSFPIYPVNRDIWLISLRLTGWFQFDHFLTFPRSFLFLCWIHVLCLL